MVEELGRAPPSPAPGSRARCRATSTGTTTAGPGCDARSRCPRPCGASGSRSTSRGSSTTAACWSTGSRVGGCFGGYRPFEVDVTDAVRPDGPNELAVGCHDWTGVFTPGRVDFSRAQGGWDNLRGVPRDKILSPIGGLFAYYGIWGDVTLRRIRPCTSRTCSSGPRCAAASWPSTTRWPTSRRPTPRSRSAPPSRTRPGARRPTCSRLRARDRHASPAGKEVKVDAAPPLGRARTCGRTSIRTCTTCAPSYRPATSIARGSASASSGPRGRTSI